MHSKSYEVITFHSFLKSSIVHLSPAINYTNYSYNICIIDMHNYGKTNVEMDITMFKLGAMKSKKILQRIESKNTLLASMEKTKASKLLKSSFMVPETTIK